jgi:photosystem II stability/assembly factor-like uncharacterized protein
MRILTLLVLLSSLNGFAQSVWSALPDVYENGNNQRYDDIFFIDENTGWAANGYYAKVLKTTDGGMTWVEQYNNETSGTNYYFRNIEFLTPETGFLGTLNSNFLYTTDGGSTWSVVDNLPVSVPGICGLDAVDSQTLYGCGAYFSPAYVIKTTDAGASWQYFDMSQYADALVELVFADALTGYAAGKSPEGAVILKTGDGGVSWTEIYNSGIPGEYVWKLQLLDGYIIGAVEGVSPMPGRLIRSADQGVTWISKTAPETMIQAVGFITPEYGWMGGHTTGFYETTDGGDTWTNLSVGSNLNRIVVLNDNLAYAAGTTLYKFSPNLSSDFTERARIPLEVKVLNPIGDKLHLSINFRGSDHLVMGLYSITGKHLKDLCYDTVEDSGERLYTIDFPYAAGMYLLDIHTNTGRQSIKIVRP